MKLNWFSPLPPAPTGIAEYTGTLVPWLCQKAEVTLWTDQESWDRVLERYCEVRRFDCRSVPWRDVNRADLSVFHLGNNRDFHDGIWQVSRAHAGVVVVHDLRLQDLFWGAFARKPAGSAEYIRLMEHVYGADGGSAARRFVEGTQSLDSLCLSYPLTEAVVENALGVVVHTRGGFDLVSAHCQASLAFLPFPYPAAPDSAFEVWSARRNRPARPPFQLVLLGYINPNRRIISLLQALGSLPGKSDFRLRVYGPIWDEAHVREKVREYGLERLVTLNGYTPASQLDDAIADADLAINLRFPTMGEASMSQLQVWDHALPSIVTRTGWYAELSDDAVSFVEIDREIEDLRRHLTVFSSDPESFARLGENGRAALLEQHSPAAYVESLVGFLEKTLAQRPARAFTKAAQDAAEGMKGWVSAGVLDRAAESIAGSIGHFLPGSDQ